MELFFRQLIRRMALRLAEDLEPGKAVAERQAQAAAQARRASSSRPPPYTSAV